MDGSARCKEEKTWEGNIVTSVCSALESGLMMIIGNVGREHENTISDFSSMFEMPYLSIAEPPTRVIHHRLRGFTNHSSSFSPSSSSFLSSFPPPSSSSSSSSSSFTIYLRPSLSRPIRDVILYFQWARIYYIYDHMEGLQYIGGYPQLQGIISEVILYCKGSSRKLVGKHLITGYCGGFLHILL
ncbi:hypothetical protein HELRODRAFT_170256 [Helobdella robusta]|uniref:Uncharacterized protein n=1 Tax=Helobdella robusta TaxID=6412 RepID=T1F2U4_HELRO|nr:hypothetical protein HELRODRAFT_170256 [Helobdella robusta]ESO07715.1 hypothetical protein HELRODRAFT_170256 [Helobdella robusta]